MKKVSVVYATKTGHSKKLAEAVGLAIGAAVYHVADRPSLGDLDLLFVVGGIYGGESAPELLEFVSGLSGGIREAALITSSASNAKGQDSVRARLRERGIPIADEYRCLGGILFVRAGHPNRKEIQDAVHFAVRLAEKQETAQ
jgi:flavodoxin